MRRNGKVAVRTGEAAGQEVISRAAGAGEFQIRKQTAAAGLEPVIIAAHLGQCTATSAVARKDSIERAAARIDYDDAARWRCVSEPDAFLQRPARRRIPA